MDLQVDEAVKEERLARLLRLLQDQAQAFNDATIGQTLRVLFTRKGKHDGQALGYSPYMQPVHVDAGAHLIGQIAEVAIVGATMSSLSGRIVERDAAMSGAASEAVA